MPAHFCHLIISAVSSVQCDFQAKNIKGEKMEESLGLGKKSSGPKTDTETLSWFRLPIQKPGFGHTLAYGSQKI